MKKINLIKWLWDDSHEKQTPQRFGRYAVMLIMLLTLGVGQMWAGEGYNGETHVYLNVDGTTKYYKVSTESWSTGSSLPGTWGGVLKDQTFSNIHTLEIKGGAVGGWTENGGNISGNLYYKVTNSTTTPSSGWTTVGGINASYTTKSGNNCFRYKNDYSVNVTPHTAGTYYLHIKITDGASNNRTSYVKFTIPSYTVAGSSTVLGTNWDQTDTDNDMVWSSGTTYTLTKSNVVLTKDNTYEYKVAYNHAWTTAYPASNASIDFGNTTGHYDVTFTFNASTHAVSATATRLYAVIYNDNGKTSGSVPATSYHANGATVTVASNSGSLAKTGYSFGGWNTNSSGTGTNYTAGSGTFTMGSSDKNLYAKWTENMTTVSFVASPTGKGTFQVNSSTVTSTTAGVTTTKSVTAVPISGYRFSSWAVTGDASISSTSTNPTTVTGGGAGSTATLTATFEEDLTYFKLKFGARSGETSYGTVAAEDGSGAPLTSNTDYLSGTSVTVTATATDDDYKFDSWYNAWTGGSSVSTDNPLTFTLTAATDRYAHFVRKTTSITLNKGIGSGGTAGPVTATHGSNTLSPSISVNPAKSGYTFTGYWTASSGGVKVIDTNGALITNVSGYTKSSNNQWDYDEETLDLYAQYSENMTDVTLAASPAGSGTFTIGGAAATSTTAGRTTTRSVTAVPGNGYYLSGTIWSKSNENITLSSTTTNPTTVTGCGTASTSSTLTATFKPKWYLKGAFNSWGTTHPFVFTSSTSGYVDVELDGNSTFKLYDDQNSQWYGSQYGIEKGVRLSTELWSDNGNDCPITINGLAGTYRFTLDISSGKVVTVTPPTFNQIRFYSARVDGDLTNTYDFENTGSSTWTKSVNLTAGTTYWFKVLEDGTYLGNDGTMTRANCTNWTMSAANNCGITADITGSYTFSYVPSTNKLSITYPTAYKITYGKGDVDGNEDYDCTAVDIDNSRASVTSNSTWVKSGNRVELTAPDEKTGFAWKGWYDNTSGTGVAISENKVCTLTVNSTKTAYACYTENEYNVAVSAGSNGSVSPSGTVAVKQVNGTSLTATADEGYHFDHWAISGGGITPSSSTTSPQTFKATETGGTIQAIFAETTYTVNVNSGNPDFGSVSTTSVSGIGIATYSDEITATPETGATFTGWTLPSGVTAAAGYTSSSNPIKINATASGKAITANFSETKHTATITTEDDDYGTVSPTSASVGQITAVQITASKKTGYMFAGWVKTAGSGTVTYHVAAGAGSSTSASGSNDEIAFITIDGNVTLQATWAVDRSSGWALRGTWQDGAGWSDAADKNFVKDEGEEAGSVSHVRWALAPEMFDNATMQMKMYEESTYKYYGHMTNIDDSGNLCTKDANNTNIQFYGDNSYQNFKVSIPVAGIYDFEWNSSTKQLTIHYPAGNFIRGTFDSWSWDHVLEPTGNANEYSCVISMTGDKAPHAWTGSDGFKVVLGGDHYGKNSSGVTRASNSVSGLGREGNNINWTTDVRGDYTFTVNSSSKTVTVTYPNAYTVTYGYGAGGSSVSASATSVGGTFSSGAYVAAGDDITFTQTAVDGNTFKGWYTTADGNTTVSTMGVSDNVLNSLAGNATVYAQYIPTTYTDVTLNKTVGESNGAYSVTFGGTTITITTAPLKTGYEPEGYYYAYADGNWTEKVATTAGQLQTGTNYTDGTGHWTATNSPTLYTKWQPKTYTIRLDKNGSSAGYLTNGSVTATYDSNTLSPLTAPTRTGYHVVDGYYKEPELTNKIINVNGTLCASTDYTDGSGNWTNDGAVTLYAKWEPNNYTITFAPAGGSVDPTSASVTFDAAISIAPVPERTGYDFTGYNTAGGASITTNTGVFKASVDGFTDVSAHWVKADDATITAQWSAKTYTITLTQSGETGYGSAGTASVEATYDAALPTIDALPTAANGYAFMGYYTGHNGSGTQYYDATGTKIVASYTTADDLELFAYFKKAAITGIAFSPGAIVEPESTVTVTPTIDPTPVGTTVVCWRLLYSNESPLSPAVTFTAGEGNTVSFTAPAASGTYKVEAVLHLGEGCGGEELSTYLATLQVAGEHTVTVQYKDASGNTLQASTEVTGKPLAWSESDIVAPDIFGYTFHHWDAGDGVTIKAGEDEDLTTSESPTIKIKAIYDGRLTAVYNQKQMIYFKNTLNWSDVYVNFYSSDYWDSDKGSGNENLIIRNRQMTRIDDTDVWYFDYGSIGISPSQYVSFTEYSHDDTNGVKYFWKETVDGGANVVYPARRGSDLADKANALGFYAATPMFVPLATQPVVVKNGYDNGKANYYNDGYWTKYTAGTGYTLELYYNSDGSERIQSIPFTSENELMPMTAVADLEAGTTYRYQLKRDGDVYYGNSGTMTYANHGQTTAWEMTPDARRRNDANTEDVFAMCKLTTNASGNYTFNLTYSGNSATPVHYCLRMEVDYPIASGDYRLLYKDDVHTLWHPSAIIPRVKAKDTVSFFVRTEKHAYLKLQKCTGVDNGTVSWTDTITWWNNGESLPAAITKDSVYNICLKHNAENNKLEIENVEGYTGNFYIRTNAAGGWDNFRSTDHLMTYSEYSERNADYSHYFMAYVGDRTNVKFVVANDYSMCISDTLAQATEDASDVQTNGDILVAANVRFMWDRKDNSVGRAYLAAAKSDGSNFLVLRANSSSDLMDENGNALINSANSGQAGYNHKAPDNSVQFVDDDNWIYETTVKVKPSAYVKLYAHYHDVDHYYKGRNGDDFNGTVVDGTPNAIQILGGEGDAQKIRVLYDFKTDRLVAAYIPSAEISGTVDISADVMLIRDHQNAAQQLTFSDNEAVLQNVRSVYGVMRFNRWTLNNKSTAAGHAPLSTGEQKSIYERSLYFISFPFDVNLSDVFGFGTYWDEWYIEYYDGAGRAEKGLWADSPSYWKYVTRSERNSFKLEAGKGYLLGLDLDYMADDNTSFWTNNIEFVELFFPSASATVGDIKQTDATISVPEHECKIGPRPGMSDDRTKKDSHWNVIGVPSYANYGTELKDGSNEDIKWNNPAVTEDLPFLYEWQMIDNTLTPKSGTTYEFKAMHAYVVQYAGTINWKLASATPAAPGAPRNENYRGAYEFKLVLKQNDKAVDQTFVRLTDKEEVTNNFDFNYDLVKEIYASKANLYTMVEGYIQTAGNCLPLTEQTTVVPVGVKVAADGDYTFCMPDGTEGIGITLIDTETGIRTPLSALDYTIGLSAGTYDERFVMEISAIEQTATGVEAISDEGLTIEGARKVMIDGILYIVKDGKLFDARGARVQ